MWKNDKIHSAIQLLSIRIKEIRNKIAVIVQVVQFYALDSERREKENEISTVFRLVMSLVRLRK